MKKLFIIGGVLIGITFIIWTIRALFVEFKDKSRFSTLFDRDFWGA